MRLDIITKILVLFIFFTKAYSTTITAWNTQNQENHAAICFTVNSTVQPHVFTLPNPLRVVVDFPDTHLAYRERPIPNKGLITRVRIGNPNMNTLRFVLEVTSNSKNNLESRKLPHGYQEKCVNLFAGVAMTTVVKQIEQRDVIVVLDPGHGGKDPGAHGPHLSLEKNIVLAIAQRLKQKIDKTPGMHAILTRNADYYVGLRQRLKIARKNNADIFVAIHADAFGDHESNGASVFALSPNGATSEAARWLAEKENYSELGGVNLADLKDQNGLIRTVLIDLSQTATIGASLQIGSKVLQNLDKITRLHNHRVEQARFVVLKSPDIPSVLIETGFISNPREELNLTNPSYQDRLTSAILAGLMGYFWEHPPHGSKLESLSRRHIAYNIFNKQVV